MGHILVIDDEEHGLTGIVRRLFEPEHRVSASNSAPDVVAQVTSGTRFDAIVCRSAWAKVFHEVMHAVDVQQARRVLFIGGWELRESLSSPPNRFLREPFVLNELRAAVEGLLLSA